MLFNWISGLENPDSKMGCYACQPDDYDRFKPFFAQVLAMYHGVSEDATHRSDWNLTNVQGLPESGVLDVVPLGLPPLSMRVQVARNLGAPRNVNSSASRHQRERSVVLMCRLA
eukprot:SAG31_NODE_971_length_10655_cov_35.774915_5_plen_114_part_00